MMITTILLAATITSPVDLTVAGMKHVTFDGIPATTYRNDGAELVADVNKSASFVLLPFTDPIPVKRVTFVWQSSGKPPTVSADVEKTKAGDDFPLRIGLVVSGKAPMIPFFAPSWVKAIAGTLKHPSDKLIYLTAGAKSPVGSGWESPYSDSMELISVGGERAADGYETVTATLPSPLTLVGLWIMADADQTGAAFTTRLKSLSLE